MESSIHQSVLLSEVLAGLAPKAGGVYIDATCGLGGHAEAILSASSPTGKLLAIDRDPVAIEIAKGRLQRFSDRLTIVEGDFSDLRTYAEASDHVPADGVVVDLGVSSLQLDDAERGFSFSKKGPLDMRMGPRVGATAGDLIETFSEEKLHLILREFGELHNSRTLARAILAARERGELGSTEDLARVIERASGGRKMSPIHPATRAFQAIRIAVNRELDELEKLLDVLPDIVRPGGRVAVISFHSLEDRLVKHAFRDPEAEPLPPGFPVEPERARGPWQAITKKPITPSASEVKSNPRARSAKLRVAERRTAERA